MNQHFSKISEVFVQDKATYTSKTFISFDVDWSHDRIMRDTHELLTKYSIPSTWFVTHKSDFLNDLRADSNVELGIHPNFNKLLVSDYSNGRTVGEVIDRLLEIVPEARSVRAHSLLQSSRILEAYVAAGLTHEAAHFVDPAAVDSLNPWLSWDGLVRVPMIWGDYLACLRSPGNPSLSWAKLDETAAIIRHLNFHPIHVYLNSKSISDYEATRLFHHRPDRLADERNFGNGVRNLLVALLENRLNNL